MTRNARGLLLLALVPLVFPSRGGAESLFPLKLYSPAVPPRGAHLFRIGLEYNDGEPLFFQNADTDRRVYSLPEFDAVLGIASDMELGLRYPLLYLKQNGQAWEYGSGDVRIAWIYRLLKEKGWIPETGIRIAVKLPNAVSSKGFGTDETDFFAGGLFAKRAGAATFLLNAELGILGNPNSSDPTQDDVLIYGAGVVYSLSRSANAGFGVDGVGFSRYGNDRLFVRAGASRVFGRVILDAGFAVGLTEDSGNYQVIAGISIPFGGGWKDATPLSPESRVLFPPK